MHGNRREVFLMRFFRTGRIGGVLAAVMAGFLLLLAGTATAAPAAPTQAPAGAVTAPVTGTFTDANGGTGTFTGTYTVERFVENGDAVLAEGTLTGVLTDATGADAGTVDAAPAALPLDPTATAAGCQVLDLVLGPLDLDLLGLVVHLNQVHLNITAVPGAGALLGNLLCAVAGLLDGGPLAGLAGLLNQILAILAGL
jgi:hypothetical protein